ncbi:hypothetical protein SAMD00019534_019410 [Acytostelium subglobosum LB1]|uniref:hypothetical protein n=1 Tax=Acytostelium subglobosum LB1 TaxID=1410327 RepID=UPI00064485DD|nr:hypothetical protein SAMD00019534_019410 [Acytostelium subglobosum LB1]GAM18766.1 hypothetical protein SAMD00019534_019410 [Acytostelium subglobosum LB1]|eukprot:XP_012757986.1 hypothetical protein SAMD00019534_019410 [Acytostelium subglobosum LB1]
MVSVSNPQKLNEALAHYRRPENASDWIIVGYSGPATLEFRQAGNGGASALIQHLRDDECAYVFVREEYTEGDAGFKEGVIGNKANTKDIFIAWTGPKVGIIEKGKKKSHVGDAKVLFQPFHAELTAINRANFNDVTVKDRSNPLSGSHVID